MKAAARDALPGRREPNSMEIEIVGASRSMQKNIKVAIAGVGNCASALVQGVEYYRSRQGAAFGGIMRHSIGGYKCSDVEFVAAFDIDQRKVGHPLEEAIFAKPNCTRIFQSALPVSNVIVQASPVLDGVAEHMADYPDDAAFRSADLEPTDVTAALRASGAEILVCYLPVGSERAVKHYAQACLDARVAMINCVPVFLASDSDWAQKFRDAGIPIVGDDIKSQVGATIVHRALARLFADRGVSLDRTYQLNTGGNTDFLNMLERGRLKSKKISKTESVQSQLDERLDTRDIHIGPSDYVPWQKDNKVCFIRMEGRGFGDAPIELEMRLSVEDSPNSAGVVIDAIRCAKLALERGEAGPLEAPSAYYMKSPPRQFRDSVAREACNAFIDGRDFDLPAEAAPDAKVAVHPGRS
jgi:myo-inositol-1-phosphate synthase